MQIREPNASDRETLLTLMDAFYHSSAVLHPIPTSHFEQTFQKLLDGCPFVQAYLIEQDGKAAGYALLALTWSNEAGGETVWIDEVYICPEYQGQGLGRCFFDFLHSRYDGRAVRFRLETEPDNEAARRLYARLGYRELPYLQMMRGT